MAITKVSPDLLDLDSGITITVTDNSDNLTLVSTDADANVGPNLNLYRNSGSPADSDVLGVVTFNGRNDNSQDVIYARQLSYITDASDGTEDGTFKLQTMVAGTIRDRLNITPSEINLNEDSQDVDFRVESNGKTNMLFVNAGADTVNIGNAVGKQSIANLNVRENGASIEFGHQNNSAGYFGTLGSFGNNGHPYIGFSTASEASANTFSTFGAAGNIISGDLSGNLQFLQVSTASATGQTPVERMRILAGGGLTFNGDTAAANALDDYEEGTWTPTDAAGNVTLQASGGRYTKIGNTVWVWFRAHYPSNSDNNGAVVGGLPFTATNTNASNLDAAGGATTFLSQNTNSAYNGYVVNNTTAIYLFPIGNSTRSTNADLTNKNLYMSAQYVI